MTTMTTLLGRALRKTRARSLEDTFSGAEVQAALEDAQALFLNLTSRALVDVLVSADYTASEDERVFNTSGSSITVTMPTTVTVFGITRAPRNGSVIEVVGQTPLRRVYISELAAWSAVDGLALTDEQPFGPTTDDALSDMLAARFCSSIFQTEPSAPLVSMAMQGRTAFEARFFKPITAATDPGLRARYAYDPINEVTS